MIDLTKSSYEAIENDAMSLGMSSRRKLAITLTKSLRELNTSDSAALRWAQIEKRSPHKPRLALLAALAICTCLLAFAFLKRHSEDGGGKKADAIVGGTHIMVSSQWLWQQLKESSADRSAMQSATRAFDSRTLPSVFK